MNDIPFPPIYPGAALGIIGGGQLGRMTALAAAQLGYRVHIYTPEAGSPAGQVATSETVAAYDDVKALGEFARSVDVVTFEFENIPAASAHEIVKHTPLRPAPHCLEITQDRVVEKTFLNKAGIATTPFAAVGSADELSTALETIGRPAVLKTATMGYDGKGQVRIGPDTDAADAWAQMGGDAGILEGFVDFDSEISVILARQGKEQSAVFDVVENRHVHHILDVTIAPAPIPPIKAIEATSIAEAVAEALDLVGLIAVEMFVTFDHKILVNEIAPRPHNSGHWTIDACITSQFEQFVRAICGLPLGNPARHSNAVMKNLIGDDVDHFDEMITDQNAKMHLYGKTEVRAGRKMGHVTRLYPLEAGKAPE